MAKTVYVGVNDTKIDLFEGIYKVPNGVSYNSYVIFGDKIAVTDTVDDRFADEWLANVAAALDGKTPDYLIVSHMEPDHSASVSRFAEKYKSAKLVGNQKTFVMLGEYFEELSLEKLGDRAVVVKEGDVLDLGGRTLSFVFAPMVHWPEVMMFYESAEKTLYSADGFGKFGALGIDEPWADEARRYYIGIVGKYGVQVQNVLKKASTLSIERIRPLHGPELMGKEMAAALELYNKWSSYTPETDGVMIAYTSVYGHTKKAALELKQLLDKGGVKTVIYDLARADMSECVARAFEYDKIVLATTTYNAEIFPAMRDFLNDLVERNFQKRSVGIIENGTWAPMAAKCIQAKLEKCKDITYLGSPVKIMAALNTDSRAALNALAKTMIEA